MMSIAFKTLRLSVLLPVIGFSWIAGAHAEIRSLRVEGFETGLEVLNQGMGKGHWVDSNQVLTAALARDEHEIPGGDPDLARGRVALVNFQTRKVTIIAEDATILQFDAQSLDAIIGNIRRDSIARQIHIGPDGTIHELAQFQPGQALPPAMDPLPKGRSVRYLGLRQDGYLFADSDHLRELRMADDPVPTTWIRPGQPPIHLAVRYQEVGVVEYVPFLGKYLLNSSDSQASSATNAAKNVTWKRPYRLTPYRLLGRDGSITEFPYPPALSAELKGFNELLITRPGIAVTSWSGPAAGIYVLRNDYLYRVSAGGKSILGLDVGSMSMTGIDQPTVSPDGCRIAYLHYVSDASAVRMSMPRNLAIVDICKEAK